MKKEKDIKHWKQMYKFLADPEERGKRKRKKLLEEIKKEKIADYGLE